MMTDKEHEALGRRVTALEDHEHGMADDMIFVLMIVILVTVGGWFIQNLDQRLDAIEAAQIEAPE